MNLKQSMKRRLRGHAGETDVNLTAVMNIFLILIPFLLLTATFMRIAVLELTLPSLERRDRTASAQPQQSIVLNILQIRDEGFLLKSPNLTFPELPRFGGEYNWQGLKEQLQRIKKKYPDSEDVIISPANTIRYETIIAVMDHCREAGFPNISISG